MIARNYSLEADSLSRAAVVCKRQQLPKMDLHALLATLAAHHHGQVCVFPLNLSLSHCH